MATRYVLSIDGGGMYGVVPLEVCIAIEEAVNDGNSGNYKYLVDIFDLFVGTSAGAIVAAASNVLFKKGNNTPKELTSKEMMEFYLKKGIETIFPDSQRNNAIPILNLVVKLYGKPRYKADGLRQAISEIITNVPMDRLGPFNDPGRKTYVAFSAYNLSKEKTCFFRSWAPEDSDILAKDAVIASASAPTTHPIHKIGDDYFTDGGVFAVNPSLYAFGFARELWPDDDLVIVSLSTGARDPDNTANNVDPDRLSDLWWLKRLPSIFSDGQDETTDKILSTLAGLSGSKVQYYRFGIADLIDPYKLKNTISLHEEAGPHQFNPVELPGIEKKATEIKIEVLRNARARMQDALLSDQKNKFDLAISALKR